ncbi:hypothetical protein EWI07_01565 [Sporolactobacillus sp. THM7-4]|nr:hypothetical protein EWI07_01565 [Sporolactobacillus sp. THM7-4]
MNARRLKKILQSNYLKVFLLCLLTSGFMFLPSLIHNGGLFALVGDFNYQQIPFNMLSNRSIRSGDIFWSWSTDLGSNFIASYSFYTLGSPFFWLSLLFPPQAFQYLVGPMLMLKYCVAGLTAYGYIKRYVSNKNYAVIGALLYAFSGFSTVNLMFNHFHDVVAFFPLLLAGLDRLVEDKKRGVFAAAVALNATLNFFFFIGEAVFLVLYYCLRFLAGDFKKYIRILPRVLGEAILGIGMACFLFFPAIIFTLQNPRLDNFLYGPTALTFFGSRYLEIIKALLMPAEIMPYQSAIFEQDFTSSGAYLPLFGPLLAIAMIVSRKNWMTRLALCSLVMALVPLFNSFFYALNAAYYARWFYMPVLIMALMSSVVLEKRETIRVKKALLITTLATAALALYLLFYPWSKNKTGGIYHLDLFLIYLSITVLGILVAAILLLRYRNGRFWLLISTVSVVIFSAGTGLFNITETHFIYSDQSAEDIRNTVVKTGLTLGKILPRDQNYRIRIADDGSNLPMVSGTPTVNSFTSMVNGSIFQFYQSIESPRDVKTVVPDEYYGLEPLLSVRFYVTTVKGNWGHLYTKFNNGTDTVYVYENKNFLPIGFTYDYYMTEKEFNQIPAERRHLALLKAVVLTKKEISKVGNLLLPLPSSQLNETSDGYFLQDVRQRALESSVRFDRDRNGFTSVIHTDSRKYAFFSVPYDKGWSVKVNGRSVSILNADGFMIVPVDEGDNTIRFTYETPGLKTGLYLSISSFISFAGYLYYWRKRAGKNKMNLGKDRSIETGR